MSPKNPTSLETSTLSRRDLLRCVGSLGAGVLAASTVGCGSSTQDYVYTNSSNPAPPTPNPTPTVTPTPPAPPTPPAVSFVQPEVRRSVNGFLEVPFDIRYADTAVGTPNGVRQFRSRTINGTIAPPTMRIKPGDRLQIPIVNNLPPNPAHMHPADENTPHDFNTVNIHTHGFHVSPGQDNVLLNIPPGKTYTYGYDLPADHPPGTMWYHPHKHGATAMHLFSGMIGAIIIEGGPDDLPEIAAAADLVFNINELQLGGFSAEGTPPVAPAAPYEVPDYIVRQPFASGDSIFVVNGEYQPRLSMRPGQLVRLRILNASARNTMPLSIEGNDWHIIAFDGITLPEVRTASQFTLAPANRADVLIRIDSPGTFKITKEPFASGGGSGTPAEVLAFIDVAGEPFPQPMPSGALPVSATLPDITAGEVTEHRTLTYAVQNGTGPEIPDGSGTRASNFTIDGVRFNSRVINQIISLGSVIEWTLVNTSGAHHPHHIHVQDMQIIATSDGMLNGLPLLRPTWVDTVNIPPNGSVTLRQRFLDFPGLFVLHCHTLVHEDIGMMQLVNVV